MWSLTSNLKGPQGDDGPQGPDGPAGATGATGATGPAPNLSIGDVTTGAEGSNASVSISGSSPNYSLSFTIPRGNTGPAGTGGGSGTPYIPLAKGSYYASNAITNVASTDLATVRNRVYYAPFFLGEPVTIDRIGFLRSSSTASPNVQMGLYSVDADGLPGSQLEFFGAVIVAATGAYQFTVDTTLPAGWFYFALMQTPVTTGDATALSINGVAIGAQIHVGPGNSIGTGSINYFSESRSSAGDPQVLPMNAGSLTGQTSSVIPRIFWRVV